MNTVLAILMLAGMALVIGAINLFRRGNGKKALLMLAAALVMFGNVLILKAPIAGGGAPVTEERANSDVAK